MNALGIIVSLFFFKLRLKTTICAYFHTYNITLLYSNIMAIIYKVAHNTFTVLIIASFINDNLCYPVLDCSSHMYTQNTYYIRSVS